MEGPQDVSSLPGPVPARTVLWVHSILVGWEPTFFKPELHIVPSREVPQEESVKRRRYQEGEVKIWEGEEER